MFHNLPLSIKIKNKYDKKIKSKNKYDTNPMSKYLQILYIMDDPKMLKKLPYLMNFNYAGNSPLNL